jgi:hypothetical protein
MPGAETLGAMVREYREIHREGPDDFGLLRVPEEIRYRDPASEATAARLLLAPHFYKGSTVADLMRDISAHNTCLSVTTSHDRRTVTLGTDTAQTKSCKGWKEPRVACIEAECPH